MNLQSMASPRIASEAKRLHAVAAAAREPLWILV